MCLNLVQERNWMMKHLLPWMTKHVPTVEHLIFPFEEDHPVCRSWRMRTVYSPSHVVSPCSRSMNGSDGDTKHINIGSDILHHTLKLPEKESLDIRHSPNLGEKVSRI